MNNYNCYIHIPFCRSKCKYCRFASFSVLDKLKIQNYVDFLCKEIEASGKLQVTSGKSKNKECFKKSLFVNGTSGISNNGLLIADSGQLTTIYFGGGTPTTLSEKQFKQIFKTLEKKFIFGKDIEITVETTPEEISLEKLNFLKSLGVNRISIGVQSLNKKTLEEVKRGKKGDILEKLEIVRNFSLPLGGRAREGELTSDNGKLLADSGNLITISLDFIIGLPFVKKGEILEDIKYILKNYNFVNHISVYMLEDYYEPGEVGEKFEQIVYPKKWEENSLTSEEIGEEYLEVKNFLEKNLFFRYELSNFAKISPQKLAPSNCELETTCMHNIGYWTHKETLAFGLGASGFINNTRYKNSEDFLEYYSGKGRQIEKLKEKDLFLEKIMFSLRTSGIEKRDAKKLNKEKINYFLENSYLEEKKEKIVLSDKGFLYLDYILGEIITV